MAYSFSQGIWTQKADFGGTARYAAVGFSIGAKGYIGTGANPSMKQDFWEWDQMTNIWTQKANYGGNGSALAVGFAIGAKGYIGTSWGSGGSYRRDFWEWDQATNTWTQKINFAGTARSDAVGFSIGTKGYIGTGDDGGYRKDFWEWDQAANTWTQKANFGGAARLSAVGFSIGSKGYIGTGTINANSGSTGLQDFWEWDQAANIWIQKANFPGLGRCEAVAFTIGNYGYVGTGTTKIGTGSVSDFWKYDPSSNTWTSIPNFGGGIREIAVSFSIGCYGYVAAGFINDQMTTLKKDLWEYYDSTNTSCGNSVLNANIASTSPLCNGQCMGTATANPIGGTNPYTYLWNTTPIQTTANATGLCAGTYTVIVTDVIPTTVTATVTITQPAILTATATSTPAVCGSNNGSATATAGGGTPGYIYSWNTSQTSQTATGLSAGNYTATITDANGCTATQTVGVVSSGSVITTSQSANLCTGSTYTLPGGTIVSTSGVYMDTLISVNGCDSIITTTLTVNPNPTAGAFSNVTITQGQSTTLTATGGGMYQWSPAAGLNCVTCANPVVTASPLWGAGGLVYCVTVTDANNCTDMACVTVTIEQIDCSDAGELYLPNAFSPNGDGENDVLKIYYGDIKCIKTFNLVIYNRWGEKVFETTNPMAEWDGSFRGQIECTAVFVYYMQAALITGQEIIQKGNISLIR